MQFDLANSSEISSLGIKHLKRYWQKCILKKNNQLDGNAFADEWITDTTMLAALGLGLHQTLQQIYNYDANFEVFENWIAAINNNNLSAEKINQFNKIIDGEKIVVEENVENILLKEDIDFWNEHGYVIIKEAVSKQDCEDAINAICNFIDVDKNDLSTWYNAHPSRVGIMVQLFQHPALQKNRQSKKIRGAYEQLWQRKDIWVNTDRAGFNPPETAFWKFPGPKLHWDVSLKTPIPFGLQGILYLADTLPNQGAFTLVPGFQNKIEAWLKSLPTNVNPRTQDMYALGAKPIAANAGDFIIWHHALPHGSSANTSTKPRFVQYINYEPANAKVAVEWI